MSVDIRAVIAEHECSLEWGGPDWSCGAQDCTASGSSWDDYADHIAALTETCKHCGEAIAAAGLGYVHMSGTRTGYRRCATDPFGYEAAPIGEACKAACLGATTGIEGRVE